jgi:hypothetical protein
MGCPTNIYSNEKRMYLPMQLSWGSDSAKEICTLGSSLV